MFWKFFISLEASHKILRRLLAHHTRPFLSQAFEDAFNHLSLLTSPRQRALSGPPHVLKEEPIKTEDDRLVASFIIKE